MMDIICPQMDKFLYDVVGSDGGPSKLLSYKVLKVQHLYFRRKLSASSIE